MTVVVRGGRIAAVGRDGTVEVPAGAVRVNGAGRFLIPGLWDAHAHVSYPGECALPVMIAHGITSVRDLGGPPAEGIAWRREIAAGSRIGPRLYLAGLNIESAAWMDAVEGMIRQNERDPERRIRRLWEQSPRFKVGGSGDARTAVDTARRLGMDVVKFRNLGDGSFRALAEAARRARIPLAGHSPKEITLAEAAEAGLGSLEHGANLGDLARLPQGERREQYARLVRSGMFVTPTLVSDGMWSPDSLVLAVLADTAGRFDSRRRTLSRAQREMWADAIRDRRQWSQPMPKHVHDSIFGVEVAWVREAHRAGVPLLAGTDLGTILTFPGSSLHEELALLVERVGLAPVEALRSATVHPARFFGLEQELGGIAAGKRADLVLLRADPLRDIRNVGQIEGVVAAGRYFGPDDIAALKTCGRPGG
jgi:imidazolonepropionase-like amidohydrolase